MCAIKLPPLQRSLSGSLLGVCLLLAVGSANADLINPAQVQAEQRFKDNPQLVDQTDQYCHQRKINAACALPGNVFEGGGAGQCQRELLGLKITLQCQRTASVVIERNIPPFAGFDAPPPPADTVVTDRFCQGKASGAVCEVALLHNSKPEIYAGVCQLQAESVLFYGRLYRPTGRSLLTCEPAQAEPPRQYSPVSLLDKLKPLFMSAFCVGGCPSP